MMIPPSDKYARLTAAEFEAALPELKYAWKDINMPELQYTSVVFRELDQMRRGDGLVAPYAALVDALRGMIMQPGWSLLDVGAASGYYNEVIRYAGFDLKYTGLDFSPAFKNFAMQMYPDIDFRVGDATALPFADKEFNIVISGGCIMHIPDYKSAILEMVRVARNYVVLHRTPVSSSGEVEYYIKLAYNIPVIEIHFSEKWLIELFEALKLEVASTVDISADEQVVYRTYTLGVPA